MRFYFLVCIVLLYSNFGFSNEESNLAMKLFSEAKYQESAEVYQKLIDQGFGGERLLYNAALAYYKSGQYAKAILLSYRALLWNPNCLKCKQNLAIYQAASGVEPIKTPESTISKVWKSARNSVSASYWFFLSTLCFGLGLFLFKWKKRIGFGGVLFFISMLSFLLAWSRDDTDYSGSGAVVMKNSNLYLSPDTLSQIKSALPAGEKLLLLDEIGTWKKVRLSDLNQGWVQSQEIEIIKL